ncbi:MAG: redoxin domain-containing protein, partial [Anaerolineales bacterium]
MNRIAALTFALTLALASCLAASSARAAAIIGKPAPPLEMTDTSGEIVRLDEFKGKVVVLEWVNFECPFVRKHYGSGNMQKLQKTYTGKDVVWISICSSAPGKQGHLEAAEANALVKEEGA